MSIKKSDNLHNDPMDQFFRDKLSQPEAAAPMGDWPLLEKRVREHFRKEKKRRFIIFFFLFLLLGSGVYFPLRPVQRNEMAMDVKTRHGQTLTGETIGSGQNKNNEKDTKVTDSRVDESSPDMQVPGDQLEKSPSVTISKSGKWTKAGKTDKNKFISARAKKKKSVVRKEAETFSENTDIVRETPTSDGNVTSEVITPAADTTAKKQTRKKPTPAPLQEEEAEAEDKFSWVDVHTGFNRTTPILSGQNGQPGYFQKRRKEETGSIRASYGVSFFYKVNRIIGSFGADITSYGETVDYSAQAVKRFQTVSGGQFVYRDSTISNQAFVAREVNRLNYVEFPLYIGYEFPTKGKIGISVMGGLSMGFLVGSTNTYIDTALTGAYVYENRKNETFRQQVFSAGLLPSVEYRMRSFSTLYIAFPVRYQLSSVLHHDSGVKQRYFSPGVQLGFRFLMKEQ